MKKFPQRPIACPGMRLGAMEVEIAAQGGLLPPRVPDHDEGAAQDAAEDRDAPFPHREDSPRYAAEEVPLKRHVVEPRSDDPGAEATEHVVQERLDVFPLPDRLLLGQEQANHSRGREQCAVPAQREWADDEEHRTWRGEWVRSRSNRPSQPRDVGVCAGAPALSRNLPS